MEVIIIGKLLPRGARHTFCEQALGGGGMLVVVDRVSRSFVFSCERAIVCAATVYAYAAVFLSGRFLDLNLGNVVGCDKLAVCKLCTLCT